MGDEDIKEENEQIRLPPATFIEDVEQYLEGKTADDAIKELNENHQLYKLVEQQLMTKRGRLMIKLPEIQKALDCVKLLQRKRDGEVHFNFALSDQVFAKAVATKVESVSIWLGADVMLEYPLDEAAELLASNLATCKANLQSNQQDMSLIKDWVTTTQVNLARVFNHDVTQRRLKKAGDKSIPAS